MLQLEASELGNGHAEPILCFVSPRRGYVRRGKSMFPEKFMWQLKVTSVSVLAELKVSLDLVGASASSSSMLPSSLPQEMRWITPINIKSDPRVTIYTYCTVTYIFVPCALLHEV